MKYGRRLVLTTGCMPVREFELRRRPHRHGDVVAHSARVPLANEGENHHYVAVAGGDSQRLRRRQSGGDDGRRSVGRRGGFWSSGNGGAVSFGWCRSSTYLAVDVVAASATGRLGLPSNRPGISVRGVRVAWPCLQRHDGRCDPPGVVAPRWDVVPGVVASSAGRRLALIVAPADYALVALSVGADRRGSVVPALRRRHRMSGSGEAIRR